MDSFWKEPNFIINRLFFECLISRLDTGWTLYIYRRRITFSTVGRRLGLLYIQDCTNAGILQSTTGAE